MREMKVVIGYMVLIGLLVAAASSTIFNVLAYVLIASPILVLGAVDL